VGVRTLTLIAVPSDQSRVSMTDPSAPLMALNASNIICAASTSSFRNWSRSPRELSRLPNSALAVDGARRLLPDENIAAAVPLRCIGDCTRCAYRRHFGRVASVRLSVARSRRNELPNWSFAIWQSGAGLRVGRLSFFESSRRDSLH